MASQNVFEVVSLKFIFYRRVSQAWNKRNLVREEFNKYLSLYVSNTKLNHSSNLFDDKEVVLNFEFSKGVSFKIVVDILDHMYSGTAHVLDIEYKATKKSVIVKFV